MKRFIAFLVCTVLAGAAFAQTSNEWITQKLEEKISVKFPKKPESLQEGTVFRFFGADSIAYTASARDLAGLGLSEEALTPLLPDESFQEQFKGSFTGQIPGLELTDFALGTWNDFTCYNIKGKIADKSLTVYIKCVFIGTKMVTLFCSVPAKADAKSKDDFINSLVYTK